MHLLIQPYTMNMMWHKILLQSGVVEPILIQNFFFQTD